MYVHFQRSQPGKHERYPVIHVHLDDLDYYWGWVKITSADYGNYLVYRAMENALRAGNAERGLQAVHDSVKKKGLVNPLIVAMVNSRLYVIVGCRRLAALRVLGCEELIPCRLSPIVDEFMVLDAYPQKSVSHGKHKWNGASTIG